MTKEDYKKISQELDKVNLDDSANKSLDDETEVPHQCPAEVTDFDKENWTDPLQVSNYAMDIFNYLRGREVSTQEYRLSKLSTAKNARCRDCVAFSIVYEKNITKIIISM